MMQTTDHFLDAIKEKHGLTSDYQLAKRLTLQNSSIAHYRNGRSKPDDDVALKIAKLLDMHPGYVLTCIHAERTKTPGAKAALLDVARKATVGIVMLFALAHVPPAPAAMSMTVYYVKLLLELLSGRTALRRPA